MKLIIAEKPSLARTVAKALGKYEDHSQKDRTGYLENESSNCRLYFNTF